MSSTRSIGLSAGFFCFLKTVRRRFLFNSVTKYEERNAKALNQIFCNLNPGHSDRDHQSWLNMLHMAGFPELWSACDQRNWRKGVRDAGFLFPGLLRGVRRTGPLCRSTHSLADLSWEWNWDFMNNCGLWTEKQTTQPWALFPTCMNWSSPKSYLYVNVTVSKICQKIKPIREVILGGVGNGYVVSTRKQMQTCGVKVMY